MKPRSVTKEGVVTLEPSVKEGIFETWHSTYHFSVASSVIKLSGVSRPDTKALRAGNNEVLEKYLNPSEGVPGSFQLTAGYASMVVPGDGPDVYIAQGQSIHEYVPFAD